VAATAAAAQATELATALSLQSPRQHSMVPQIPQSLLIQTDEKKFCSETAKILVLLRAIIAHLNNKAGHDHHVENEAFRRHRSSDHQLRSGQNVNYNKHKQRFIDHMKEWMKSLVVEQNNDQDSGEYQFAVSGVVVYGQQDIDTAAKAALKLLRIPEEQYYDIFKKPATSWANNKKSLIKLVMAKTLVYLEQISAAMTQGRWDTFDHCTMDNGEEVISMHADQRKTELEYAASEFMAIQLRYFSFSTRSINALVNDALHIFHDDYPRQVPAWCPLKNARRGEIPIMVEEEHVHEFATTLREREDGYD
jgi:hypothetical protein